MRDASINGNSSLAKSEGAKRALVAITRLGDAADRVSRPFRPILRLTSSMRTITKMALPFSRLSTRQRR